MQPQTIVWIFVFSLFAKFQAFKIKYFLKEAYVSTKPHSCYLGLFGEASSEVRTPRATTENGPFLSGKSRPHSLSRQLGKGPMNSCEEEGTGWSGKADQLWLTNGMKEATARSPSYSSYLVICFCFTTRHILTATSRAFSWLEHTQGFYSQSLK